MVVIVSLFVLALLDLELDSEEMPEGYLHNSPAHLPYWHSKGSCCGLFVLVHSVSPCMLRVFRPFLLTHKLNGNTAKGSLTFK